MNLNFIHKKNGKDNYIKFVEETPLLVIPNLGYEHFFWGHGEHEWPLQILTYALLPQFNIILHKLITNDLRIVHKQIYITTIQCNTIWYSSNIFNIIFS